MSMRIMGIFVQKIEAVTHVPSSCIRLSFLVSHVSVLVHTPILIYFQAVVVSHVAFRRSQRIFSTCLHTHWPPPH